MDWCNFTFDLGTDFCVWVLEADGLHVPPFDRHPAGRGPLQAHGLTEAAWRSWLGQVLQTCQRIASSHRPSSADRLAWLDPAGSWRGEPAVRELLGQRWREYWAASAGRKASALALNSVLRSPEFGELWQKDLRLDRIPLALLNVRLVGYPAPVAYVVMPGTLLLGFAGRQPGVASLRDALLGAVGRLLGAADPPASG